MKFIYLKHEQINEVRWNRTIADSAHPLTYAYSWYLNSICENWGAIIATDYSLVMPLPFTTKLRNRQIYMPPFTPKLGYFFTKNYDKNTCNKILKLIPVNTTTLSLTLNKLSVCDIEKITFKKHYFSIDLFDNYNIIVDRYTQNLKFMLFDDPNKFYVISGIVSSEIIAFLTANNLLIDSRLLDILRRLVSITILKKTSKILSVYSAKNELVGIGIFVYSHQTADLVFTAAKNGDPRIIAQMIDDFIRSNAGKILTLNFETTLHTTSKENLFSEFGAIRYYKKHLHFKRLPKIIRFLSPKIKI